MFFCQGVCLVLSIGTKAALLKTLTMKSGTLLFPLGQLTMLDRKEIVQKELDVFGKKLSDSAFNNQVLLSSLVLFFFSSGLFKYSLNFCFNLKTLLCVQLQTLITKKGAASPLYLHLACEELRNFASFDKVHDYFFSHFHTGFTGCTWYGCCKSNIVHNLEI